MEFQREVSKMMDTSFPSFLQAHAQAVVRIQSVVRSLDLEMKECLSQSEKVLGKKEGLPQEKTCEAIQH